MRKKIGRFAKTVYPLRFFSLQMVGWLVEVDQMLAVQINEGRPSARQASGSRATLVGRPF